MSNSIIHTHPTHDTDTHFSIDLVTRAVTNTETKKTSLMQYDHNSEIFTFELDRYIEEHDMASCNKVEVHYLNINSSTKEQMPGVYEVRDFHVNPENDEQMIFSWSISGNATLHPGPLNFLILFACEEDGVTTYRWNTAINSSVTISKGMNNGGFVAEINADIVNQWMYDFYEWKLIKNAEHEDLKKQTAARNYAYEAAVKCGFKGSLEDWLLTMKGEKGDPTNIIVSNKQPSKYPYFWFDTSAGL